MHLLVDPVLLAVPTLTGDNSHDTRNLFSFTQRLDDWKKEIGRGNHQFCLANECLDAVYADDCFPFQHTLIQRQKALYLEGRFSPQAAFLLANKMVQTGLRLEDLYAAHNLARVRLAAAPTPFTSKPDLLPRLPPLTRDAFRHSLACVAWLQTRRVAAAGDAPAAADFKLLTHPVDGNALSLHADLDDDECPGVDGALPLVCFPADLARFLAEMWPDPAAVVEAFYELRLKKARDEAAASAAKTGQKQDSPNVPPLREYKFDKDFVDTLKDRAFHRPGQERYLEKTFEMCVDILTTGASGAAEVHRKGIPGSAKGVAQKAWQIFRAKINDDTPGYRLHYYVSADNQRFYFDEVALHDPKKDKDTSTKIIKW